MSSLGLVSVVDGGQFPWGGTCTLGENGENAGVTGDSWAFIRQYEVEASEGGRVADDGSECIHGVEGWLYS
jgi:hypothetical protein